MNRFFTYILILLSYSNWLLRLVNYVRYSKKRKNSKISCNVSYEMDFSEVKLKVTIYLMGI